MKIAYLRISTDHQDLDRQRDFARKHGVDKVIEEAGHSAFKVPVFDRPGGRELCALIEEGLVTELHADALDRLSRRSDEEWVTFRALCRAHGTRIFIDGRELADDLGGRLEGYLKAALAHEESAEKARRVQTGKRTLAAQGYWPHGPAPLGYQSVLAPDTSRHVLVPSSEAHVVTEAFRLFVDERASQRDVVRYVSKATGRQYDRTFARNSLLRNVVYRGRVRNGHEEFDGLHPALVDEARFTEAQRMLTRRPGKKEQPPRVWPFTGKLLRCAGCGAALRYREQKRRYRYLTCGGSSFPEKVCQQGTMHADDFEYDFVAYIAAVAVDLRRRLEDPTFAAEEREDAAEAQQRLDDATVHLADAVDLVLDGSLDKNDERYLEALSAKERAEGVVLRLTQQQPALRDQLEAVVERVEELRGPDDQPFVSEKLYVRRFTEGLFWAWWGADLATKKKLVETTLDRVEASPADLALHLRAELADAIRLPAVDASVRTLT